MTATDQALAVIRELAAAVRLKDGLVGAQAREAIEAIRDRAKAEMEAATLALVELRDGSRPGAFIQDAGTLERVEANGRCEVDYIFRAAEYRVELRLSAKVLHHIGTTSEWNKAGSGLISAKSEAARWLDRNPAACGAGLSVVIVETITRRRYRRADVTTYTGTTERYEMLDFGAGRGLQDEERVVWTSREMAADDGPRREGAIP